MERALELATRGWGCTSPNPMVGALIIKDDKIVGEGFHEAAGLEHGEIVAIKEAGNNTEGATLVVNLEPCCHHGKTPPCTDLIIQAGIKKVVYGMVDPNPAVSGKGIAKLQEVGIETVGPILESECLALNRIFVHWIKTNRPYIISKVATSLDGKIATKNGNSKWITGEKARQRTHYWRAGVDGVLVGAETVRKDDPLLNARIDGHFKQPVSIVVTSSGEIDADRNIWKREPKPIIICPENISTDHLSKKGADVIKAKGDEGGMDWELIINELGKKDITSLLVEGGGSVHAQLIGKKLSQYMVASLSLKLIGSDGLSWLPEMNLESVEESPRLSPDQILVLGGDVVVEGEIKY
jgi:diaminohydroxyphosphoribosylaminopyrimidine deaminase/5-amino-6-(5-phosphoribosylamino)uracil reductase